MRMSGLNRNLRKNLQSSSAWEGLPASKRLKVSSLPKKTSSELSEEDDAFADDDITGEELEQWEIVASQAEIKLTKQQSEQPQSSVNGHKQNGLTNVYSFKEPISKITSNSTNATSSSNSLLKELQTKLKIFERKVKELEQSYKMKDGETMVLRDRLAMTEKNLSQEKVKLLEVQHRHDLEEAEWDKKALREIEKYKDQVQFKQAEIMESQNLINNLEAKYKQLEQQNCNSRLSTSTSNNRGSGLSDTGWTSTQDMSIVPAKKMRYVKPQSPRVQSSGALQTPAFSDDPLGQKKSIKPPAARPSTSSSPCKVEKTICKSKETQIKLKLKSKHIFKDKPGQAMIRRLLSEQRICWAREKSTCSSPLLQLLNFVDGNGALGNVRNLLQSSQGEVKVFGNLCLRASDHCGSRVKDMPELLSLVDGALGAFTSLQDSLLKGRAPSQDTSPFYTAPSAPLSDSALAEVKTPTNITPRPDTRSNLGQNALAALQVLEIVISQLPRPLDDLQTNVANLLQKVFKMLESDRWNARLMFCKDILSTSLRVVALLAKSSEGGDRITRFSPIMRNEVILPLVTHDSANIKHSAIKVLRSLVLHPPFALVVVKEDSQAGLPSILCHICDLVCLEPPQDAPEAWLDLSFEIVNLLSVLTAEHEALLVEHSCFCEVYHAADILLYNQLMLWKRDSESNPIRSRLIKSTLCLLQCCANVYADGIPNSRRDHRHQFTLTNLEEFLAGDSDLTTSFWSQELARMVKSEVAAINAETEAP